MVKVVKIERKRTKNELTYEFKDKIIKLSQEKKQTVNTSNKN